MDILIDRSIYLSIQARQKKDIQIQVDSYIDRQIVKQALGSKDGCLYHAILYNSPNQFYMPLPYSFAELNPAYLQYIEGAEDPPPAPSNHFLENRIFILHMPMGSILKKDLYLQGGGGGGGCTIGKFQQKDQKDSRGVGPHFLFLMTPLLYY